MGKVCLAMVVANERPVIERCLDSVANLIDQICISINGDEDGTQKCIEEWGALHNIPTTVWFDPWKGYGPNKTRNLLKIRTELETDYILFLDADEVFITDISNPLSYATKQDAERLFLELDSQPSMDVFYMSTHYGSYIYDRWQIIRNNQVWIWHLPYQETLVGEKSNNRSNINWLKNYARHEGHSSRNPDIYNNLKLLEEWVRENSNTEYYSRALFYLGQGYKGVNDTKAVEYYEQHFELNTGWFQERYLSALNIARLCKDPIKRKKYLLEAIDVDPRRLEAYYELMCDDFDKNWRKTIAWAIMAPKTREYPSGAFLLDNYIYDYMFDYKISIAAYYAAIQSNTDSFEDTGIFKIGMDAISRCITKLPLYEKEAVIQNIRFYNAKLQTKPLELQPTSSETPLTLRPKAHSNTTAIIIDEFYPNPDEIRAIALKLPFGVKGNFPGGRTEPYIPYGIKERIENIVGDTITYWPSQYNGSFQYTTADHKSWIHRDSTEWSLVVYLTPNAPVDGGTKLYLHKATGVTKTDNSVIEKLLNDDSNNHDAWHVLDKVGNRYNRAILFKGQNSHMSDQYFGTCLEDGRLFQTYFFNTASFKQYS